MKRLVVVGAGISGLSAAHEAARHADEVPGGLEVLVLEAGGAVGGKARSVRQSGWLVEEGPTGYLDSESEFDELLRRTGIAAHKVTANEAAARRYLYHDKLREVRANPLQFALSGILGPRGLLRIAAEPFIEAADESRRESESIWDFAARRLGPQAADKLISPMVLGVFAGDARRLSLEACFPKLATLEREHGGLIRGMLATRKSRARGQRFATGPTGKLVSATEGLQSLPRMLAASGHFDTRCGARVETILRDEPGFEQAPAGAAAAASSNGAPPFRIFVQGDGEAIPAHAVVLAGECYASADLLEGMNPAVAEALREIETPPVAVVAMGFGPEVAREFPEGFGVLIPRDQGYRMLGCIWDSQLFAGRAPTGHLLVRAMLGGAVDPEAAGLDDNGLVQLTRREIGSLFGVTAEPLYAHVANWKRAIPQYDLGHPRRVNRIEADLKATPGVFLAGNGLYGVAFAKSAVTGIRQGRAAARWLGFPAEPR